MPLHVRIIGRYGNALAAVLLGGLGLFGSSKPDAGGVLAALLCLCALALFNLYVVEKAARLLSEEEWLRAELRKAELRRRLAALASGQVLPALEHVRDADPEPN